MKVINWFLPNYEIDKEGVNDRLFYLFGKFENNKFKFVFEPNDNPDIIDEPYIYHKTLLEIFLLSTKGEEGANLNISKV